jgi:hypothetical protein
MQLLVTLIEAYENNDIIDYRSSNGPHQVPGVRTPTSPSFPS